MTLTYLSDNFIFSANDSAHIVSKAIVADVLALEEILCDNLVNFFLSLSAESVPLDIELDNTLVSDKTALECWCVALINLVA